MKPQAQRTQGGRGAPSQPAVRLRWPDLLVCSVLLVAVTATALAVVQTAHESRALNHELAQLQREADRARIEYDRLLLEQGAWAGHGRVMEVAQEKLAMEAPDPFAIVIVE